MGRLLQRSGNATSLPYAFLPGNHEVSLPCWSSAPDLLQLSTSAVSVACHSSLCSLNSLN